MSKGELKGKQKLFADRYLIDQNATLAYKEVYSPKNDNVAAVEGSKLLRNPKVAEYITERQETLSNKLQITQEMVLEGYRKLAFYDIRKFYDENNALLPIKDLDEETAFALSGLDISEEKAYIDGQQIITGYTKKIKTSSRRDALDSICKVLGYNAPVKQEHDLNESFLDFFTKASQK